MELTDNELLVSAGSAVTQELRATAIDSNNAIAVADLRAIETACKPKWLPMETIPECTYVDVLIGSHSNPDFRLRITDVCKNPAHSKGWSGIDLEYLDSSICYFIGWMPMPDLNS